jgi:hypothetical protein
MAGACFRDLRLDLAERAVQDTAASTARCQCARRFRQIARPSDCKIFHPEVLPRGSLAAIKDRVNAMAQPLVKTFRDDSDLFGEGARKPEGQRRFQAASESDEPNGAVMRKIVLGSARQFKKTSTC